MNVLRGLSYVPKQFVPHYRSVVTTTETLRTVRETKQALRNNEIPSEKTGKVNIKGWVTSVRRHKRISFVDISDGSSAKPLQVLVESGPLDEQLENITNGSSIILDAMMTRHKTKDTFDVKAEQLSLVGGCDSTYPLQKKYHRPEFLREVMHLRPRTSLIRSMMIVRGVASKAVHDFFEQNKFIQVHTPILTSNDCEGAGQQFVVTTGNESQEKKENGYFGDNQALLTVSGQLHGEIFATALSNIYTFGPTFRAEDSNTQRHLSEFWMIEPEMVHYNIDQTAELGQDCVQFVLKKLMENCEEELEFFAERCKDRFDLIERLENATKGNFVRMTYSDALVELRKSNEDFGDFPLDWGSSLQTAHEKYLASSVAENRPVIVTNYPKEQKPFYSRDCDDGKTTDAFDILVPSVGELIGGSVREERYDVLVDKIEKSGMNREAIEWYIDLRKYGSVPHAGWGMGFERLILFSTGIENIRDAIPVPRHVGSLNL